MGGVFVVSLKQTWVRRSSTAGVGGARWHLMGLDGRPWCGRLLRGMATAAVQGRVRPPGPVCGECLRAERAAVQEVTRQEKAEARAARADRAARRRTAPRWRRFARPRPSAAQ